jgi:hypothetical protein
MGVNVEARPISQRTAAAADARGAVSGAIQ